MARILTSNEKLEPIGGTVISRRPDGTLGFPEQIYIIVTACETTATPGVVVESDGIEGFYTIKESAGHDKNIEAA